MVEKKPLAKRFQSKTNNRWPNAFGMCAVTSGGRPVCFRCVELYEYQFGLCWQRATLLSSTSPGGNLVLKQYGILVALCGWASRARRSATGSCPELYYLPHCSGIKTSGVKRLGGSMDGCNGLFRTDLWVTKLLTPISQGANPQRKRFTCHWWIVPLSLLSRILSRLLRREHANPTFPFRYPHPLSLSSPTFRLYCSAVTLTTGTPGATPGVNGETQSGSSSTVQTGDGPGFDMDSFPDLYQTQTAVNVLPPIRLYIFVCH